MISMRTRDLDDDWRIGWARGPRQGVAFRHLEEARRFMARWPAGEALVGLRRLLAQGDRTVGVLTDAVVRERCAALLLGGRLRCWRVPPIRAWDIAHDPKAHGPEPTMAPEEVRELREIVAAVAAGYEVRVLASSVRADWDRRAIATGVETDWDRQDLATGVETDWDCRDLEAGVETDWDQAEPAAGEADAGDSR